MVDQVPPGASEEPRRMLVTVTDKPVPAETALCDAQLSEPALAQDWLREEEEMAWAHLQAAGK
jgi:hypothetical protein